MKFGFLIFIVFWVFQGFSQKHVIFSINGQLNDEAFELKKPARNNLGQQFVLSRLDLLLSGIALHHDGTTTPFPEEYIFVNNGRNIEIDLGLVELNQLDSITFYVGVDSLNNHNDPTLWPAFHPLAPKNPDMHWGWAAGYKFVAAEGDSGNESQYFFQIHSLGDQLYKPTTLKTSGLEKQDSLIIGVNADYSQIFTNINLQKNILNHGSSKEAADLLKNLNHLVFKPASIVNQSFDVVQEFSVYPSISSDGLITINQKNQMERGSKLTITDGLGRVIEQIPVDQYTVIGPLNPGTYYFYFNHQHKKTEVHRIVVLQ